MNASCHESEDRLELYALGRLTEGEVEQTEEHLMVCEHCRIRLEETGEAAIAFREELRRTKPQEKPAREWFAWFTPRLAMGGAFAAAVLAVGTYSIGTGSRLAPVASLQLTAMRGEMQSIGAAREVDFTLTDAPATGGPFRVELVNGAGADLWKGSPASRPQGLEVKISNRLSPGDYFVRLYSGSGDLLHEYGFRVRP